MKMDVSIVSASPQTLDDFIVLADQVGEWLWHKGVRQWEPGLHRKNRDQLAYLVDNGWLVLAYHEDKLAGGCILSRIVPKEWPVACAVLSLNTLAVARFAAGRGIGGQIIHGCLRIGGQESYRLLRLDCWDGNDTLKSFYQSEGFTMLAPIQSDGYKVRLFERKVQST